MSWSDGLRAEVGEPMSNGYQGICIGGPMAGRFAAARSTRLTVYTKGAEVVTFDHRGQPERARIEPERMDYVYGTPFGGPMWIPQGWTQDQLLEELVRNYRPALKPVDI